MGDEQWQAPRPDEVDEKPPAPKETVEAVIRRVTRHMTAPLPPDRMERLRQKILAERAAKNKT